MIPLNLKLLCCKTNLALPVVFKIKFFPQLHFTVSVRDSFNRYSKTHREKGKKLSNYKHKSINLNPLQYLLVVLKNITLTLLTLQLCILNLLIKYEALTQLIQLTDFIYLYI